MVRFKNRYLLCAVEFDQNKSDELQKLSSREIYSTVRSSVESNFGDIGAGQSLPVLSVKYWSPHLGFAIVRASREHYTTVWSAITLITGFPSSTLRTSSRISVVHVGATIRACQRAAADFAERLIKESMLKGEPCERLQSAASTVQRDLAEMEGS